VHWDGVYLGVMEWMEWERALGWAECGGYDCMIDEWTELVGMHLGYQLENQSLEDLIILLFRGLQPSLAQQPRVPCCFLNGAVLGPI
jgi:hypothetical protein